VLTIERLRLNEASPSMTVNFSFNLASA